MGTVTRPKSDRPHRGLGGLRAGAKGPGGTVICSVADGIGIGIQGLAEGGKA